MAAPQQKERVLEGTWGEVSLKAAKLPEQQRVRLTIVNEDETSLLQEGTPRINEAALGVCRNNPDELQHI